MKKLLAVCLLFISLLSFGGNWIDLGSPIPVPAQTTLVSSDINRSVISFSFQGFYLSTVATPAGEAQLIGLGKSSPILEQGAPELPKFTASVIIPDQDAMEVHIVSSSYKDFPGIFIAPSKGIITRDTDPATVPYQFGPAYARDAFFPGSLSGMREPYIIRDVRGQTVIVYPFQYNPVTKVLRVFYNLTIEVKSTGTTGINTVPGASAEKKIPADFGSVLQRHFLNFDAMSYTPLAEYGNLLVISHGPYMEAIQPYVDWKTAAGYNTELICKDSIGTTAAQIKSYIADYYNTNGLTHVLLVGDAPQIPTNTGSGLGGPSDNAYGYVVGNDHYADVFIGRFSAESVADVETQVQRTLEYEKEPQYLSDDWYTTVIGIASNEGPGDDGEMDYEHIRNQQTQLLAYTYTWNPELFDGSQGGNDAPGNPNPSMVASKVDSGASLILYTGHGSKTSWSTSGFGNSHVNQLQNAGKLPFIWSVACVNGNFTSGGPCFAEAWLRATQNGQPTGAIAFLGSTINQSWNSPMEGQDEMTDILAESYNDNIKRTFAGLSINGCMKMIDTYGNDGSNMADTWTVFGDPTVMVRTAPPAPMTVTGNQVIMVGETSYAIQCNVDGARATLSIGDSILSTGLVQNNTVTLTFPALTVFPDTATLVVTAYNKLPVISDVVVIPAEAVQAGFMADQTMVIPDAYVNFSDTSAGYATSWKWSFPGGMPSSSLLKNPVIRYSNRGYFDVRLIVSNGATIDTLLKEAYITVDFPASTSALSGNQFMKVTPNPSSGLVSLVFTSTKDEVAGLVISDLSGKPVYVMNNIEVKGNRTVTADLFALPDGLYLVKVNTASGIFSHSKLIIRH